MADCCRAILSAADGVRCLEVAEAVASAAGSASPPDEAVLTRPPLADCRAILSAADGVLLDVTSPVASASCIRDTDSCKIEIEEEPGITQPILHILAEYRL